MDCGTVYEQAKAEKDALNGLCEVRIVVNEQGVVIAVMNEDGLDIFEGVDFVVVGDDGYVSKYDG